MFLVTLIVVAAVSIGTSGYLIKIPTAAWQPQTGMSIIIREVRVQKRLMPLFENVCEDSTDPIIINLSNEFNKDFGIGNYMNPDVVTNFKNYINENGLLPKGEIYSEYDQNRVTELQIIFELLYFANDFDTFYKAAAWARRNVNCGLYVDAIYLAIFNRKDTQNILIPPPYELLPNYFVNKDAIIKASLLLTNVELFDTENVREQGNSYIIDTSYSNGPFENNIETLTYFNEDIGLNTFYFFQKLNMFQWLNVSVGIKPKYGEHVYHILKQLSTRYYLERYSNGLPDLDELNWNSISIMPYNPMLIYSNGNDFTQSNTTVVLNSEDLTFFQNIEDNIATVTANLINKGYTKEEIINHLMDILVIGKNSYQNVAYKLLANDFSSGQRSPSVLAHYSTIVRDPAFWIINKKIVNLVDCALSVFPEYTRNELIFPGVEIVNVDVKKMLTSLELFEFDVTDALKTSNSDAKFRVKIEQHRLNHKPFTIKLNISSLVTQKGFAKIFLGPKVLPGELARTKNLYFLLDSFEINLKKGKNIITRTSNEMNMSEDLTSLNIIRKYLENTDFGLNALPATNIESQIRFPSRLILPKGSEDGIPFQIFVFVAPYIKPSTERFSKIEYNIDAISTPGFPLDLKIDMHTLLNFPNAFLKEIIISHKIESKPVKETGKTTDYNDSWKSNEIERPIEPLQLSLGSDYTIKREPVNYKSKIGQYAKKDYSAKNIDYSTEKQEVYKTSIPFPNTNAMDNKIIRYEEIDIQKHLDDDNFDKTIYNKNSIETGFNKSTHEIQNIGNLEKTSSEEKAPIRLLRLSARPDFTIRKQPFDYKSKRPQYGKKDNDWVQKGKYDKNIQNISEPFSTDNIITTTENMPTNEEINKKKIVNIVDDGDKTRYEIVSEDIFYKNDNNETDNIIKHITKVEYDNDSDKYQNTVTTGPKKRNPTVYDYLFKNPIDKYESLEVKIYE
ncbi:arylphorin subunit alpha-like [Battus philenor]|uniref:arylphorin subunit alpha-like n=1 Tax=Battus philenor TaxID=42288 RepID=UPI0035CF6B1E